VDDREVNMTTHRRTWQKFEGRAAEFFKSRRNVLSGSANREDRDGSDSTHERLHIECKLATRHSVYRLWDKARAVASKTAKKLGGKAKSPVIALQEKNRPGFMLCVHSDDFPDIVIAWLASLDPQQHAAVNAAAICLRHANQPEESS
jgi:hypothetical protein